MTAVADLENGIERRLDVILWFQHWAGWAPEFHPEWVDGATAEGRIPLLTWEPWTPGSPEQPAFRLARIADGAFDGYIEAWARSLKAYGKVVYLRPMHEMNGNWYPWGGTVNGNRARDYVRAWRRMHRIFDRVGAANVRWVWSPLVDDVPKTRANAFERYYPGSRYVDVLALDGYNWGTSRPGYGGWRSFDQVFGSAYDRITKLGPQPVWIAETASDTMGGDKAAWVRDMFASLSRYPRIGAVVWFHTLKERDWRATSSSDVAAAFRVIAPGARPV
jgi:beta-mannanase